MMLRVGLTGDLGSGKSTAARMLAERGAVVLSSDEMGRALMQPGQPAYAQIVAAFGSEVVAADGSLDRAKLAALAFDAKQPQGGGAECDHSSGGDRGAGRAVGGAGKDEPGRDCGGGVGADLLHASMRRGATGATGSIAWLWWTLRKR